METAPQMKVTLAKKRRRALKLVRTDARHLGARSTVRLVLGAREAILVGREKGTPDAKARRAVERAEVFLGRLADAIRDVPDRRNKAIVQQYRDLSTYLRLAKAYILSEVPKAQRGRPSAIDEIMSATTIERSVVTRFFNYPRTGPKILAREITGRQFGLSAEHVRAIERELRSSFTPKKKFVTVYKPRPR